MDIAVLGTGMVGQAIAARLDELGHHVVVGTRDPQATLDRTGPDGMGNPPYAAWQGEHPGIALQAFADAAAGAEVVVNATSGGITLEVLARAGAENLAGKVLVDIANPLDFSAGFPPTLSVKDTDSLGEQVQRAYPDARVCVVPRCEGRVAHLVGLGAGQRRPRVTGADHDGVAEIVQAAGDRLTDHAGTEHCNVHEFLR